MTTAAHGRTGSAEVVRRALFVDATEERLARLRELVASGLDVEALAALVEPHGILGLVLENLERAGAKLDDSGRELVAAKRRMLAAEACRSRSTLLAFLDEAARDDLDVVLLKGASLEIDLYASGGLRIAGDVDVLVRPRDRDAAVEAARRAGLSLSPRQLPRWWYVLTHFHLKLHPAVALLRELEIHWRLQSPALLLTVPLDDVFARRRPVDVAGRMAAQLDPLDRYLHLVTHLASHWIEVPHPDGRDLPASLLHAPSHPVKLKWIVDVVAETERLAARVTPREARDRARDWSAEAMLSAVLVRLRADAIWEDETVAWVEGLLDSLPEPRFAPSSGPPRGDFRPHEALDFRPRALRLAPRWAWPPAGYLRRRYGVRGGAALAFARLAHATRVAFHCGVAAAALPVALAARPLLAPRRRAARRAMHAPDAVFELVRRVRDAAPRDRA